MVLNKKNNLHKSSYSSNGKLITFSLFKLVNLIVLMIFTLCAFTSIAWAKSTKEEYPIVSSVSTSLTWNHSNFVSAATPSDARQYDLPEADGFGWSLLNLNMGLSRTWKFHPKLPPFFFSGGLGFTRALNEGFSRAGIIPVATTQSKRIYVNDLSLSAGWSIPGVSKLAKRLAANLGVNGTIPFNVQTRALGIKSYLSSFLSLIYATSFKLVIQSTAFVGYNVLENPTQKIDCTLAPQACQISGEDLGSPNDLLYWGGAVNMQYPIYGGLRIGLTYRMFGSLLAVAFPEEPDEFTAEYAQSGKQVGALIHGTTLSFLYGFNRTASAAQEALNKSLGGDQQDQDSFLNRLSFTFSITTNDRLYSADGSRITIPIFDFETDNRSRTTYTFGALIMI